MKRLVIVVGVFLASLASEASYLYWQVDDSAVKAYNADVPDGWFSVTRGAYAVLKDTQGMSYGTATYDSDGLVAGGKAAINTAYYSDIGQTGSGFSYFVELYNSDNTLIAKSAAISSTSGADWTAAYSENIRTASLSQIPSASLWHASGFTAVPEPTSAMLMLFGAAFLGLKRKNRRIA